MDPSITTDTRAPSACVLEYEHAERSISPGYAWAVVGMLWFVCLFNYADRQAIFSVFPLLKSEMHLSDVQLGVVGGAFMWVYAACSPLAGIVGDRVPRKALILGGLLFWSAVTLATALSTRYWHLVLFRSLEGLGEAFYFPASMSLISDYHGPRTRSRAMSLHQSSVYAGTILGGTAAGFFGQWFGWRSGFYLFGSAGVALAAILLLILREPDRGQAEAVAPAPEREDPRTALAALLRTRAVWVLIGVFVGANFVAAIFLTWMPSFLGRKFGMSLSAAGFNATAWLQVSSVLGVLIGGAIADRLARKHLGGRMLTQSIGLLLGVPFVFFTGLTRSVPLLVAALAGFGFFKGMYDANIWASLYDVVPVRRRATALGLMNAIGWLGAGAAPVAIALASTHFGMSACLSAAAAIYLVCGAGLLIGMRIARERASCIP